MLLWRESFSVFPTHVGVILQKIQENNNSPCIPHACGGDPKFTPDFAIIKEYSPRMWG